VTETTDPYLNFFRRLLRPVTAGGVGFDLSPILALIVLFFVARVVVALIRA
jgi:uncharacterized protein YggT (Ycf19 family)